MLLSTLIARRPLGDRPTDAGPRRVQASHLQKAGDGPESIDNNWNRKAKKPVSGLFVMVHAHRLRKL